MLWLSQTSLLPKTHKYKIPWQRKLMESHSSQWCVSRDIWLRRGPASLKYFVTTIASIIMVWGEGQWKGHDNCPGFKAIQNANIFLFCSCSKSGIKPSYPLQPKKNTILASIWSVVAMVLHNYDTSHGLTVISVWFRANPSTLAAVTFSRC